MSIKVCKECKQEFSPTRRWQVFCSLRCGNKARAKRRERRFKKALKLAGI